MKYNLTLTFFAALFLAFNSYAQKNEISPYSRYGYGIEREGRFVRNFGLAGAGNALESGLHVNPRNPASYSKFTLTAFEAGFEIDNLWLKGGDQSQYQSNPYFSHILFGLPIISDKWGMAFGMLPVTSVGYEYQIPSTLNEIGPVTNTFSGSGGMNKILFGHGLSILKNDSNDLSFGFNLNYYLGNINREERVIYEQATNIFNTRQTDQVSFGDVSFDFGLQYDMKLSNEKNFVIGLTYSYQDNINGKSSSLVESYTGNIGFERVRDTVSYFSDEKNNIKLPGKYGVGFAYRKDNVWVLTLDMDYREWSSIQSDTSIDFSDAFTVRTGFEFFRGDTRKKDGKLRVYDMRTRLGARYNSSFITIQGEQLQEVAGTIGVSLYNLSRVGSSRLIRGMNFGMEIGTRGKDNGVMFKEQFINFMLGISIDDRWFIKNKYD